MNFRWVQVSNFQDYDLQVGLIVKKLTHERKRLILWVTMLVKNSLLTDKVVAYLIQLQLSWAQ